MLLTEKSSVQISEEKNVQGTRFMVFPHPLFSGNFIGRERSKEKREIKKVDQYDQPFI
ncbi:hypothetical protein [Aquimarina hainanensis]|uniref:hypothetical protein n=1 Tax=Aquimarina hainanensis TaxID=1578017 RepID=UPI00361BDAE0